MTQRARGATPWEHSRELVLVDGLKYNMDLIYAVGAVPKAQTITNSNVLSKYLQHTLFAYQSETKKGEMASLAGSRIAIS